MSTALRAFLVVPIFLVLFASAGVVYAQEEDTDANDACPSAPDVYVYVSGVKYLEKVNGKVNLYGRKCVDYESGDKAAEGICTGPKQCKATICDGGKCALPKIKIEDVKKAVYEGTQPAATPAEPLKTPGSTFERMFDNTPLSEQKLAPSGNAVGDFLKQSDAQPGFVDEIGKKFEGLRNYFFPQKELNNVAPLELQGGSVDPTGKVRTTIEDGGKAEVTGFGQSQTSAPLETDRFTGGEQAAVPQEPAVPRIEQLARKVELLADAEPMKRLVDADRELRNAREAVDASAETIYAKLGPKRSEFEQVVNSLGGRIDPKTGKVEDVHFATQQDVDRLNSAVREYNAAASAYNNDPEVTRSKNAEREYVSVLETAKPALEEYKQAAAEYRAEYEKQQLTQRQYVDSLETPQDIRAAELRAEAEKQQAFADAVRKTQAEVTAKASWGLGFGLHCYGGIVCQTVTVNGEIVPLSTYEAQTKSLIYEEEAKAAKLTRLADFFASSDPFAEKIARAPLDERRAGLVLKHVDEMLEARSQIIPYDPTLSPEQPADDRAQRLVAEKEATIERLISGGDLTAAERNFLYPSTVSAHAIDLDSQRQRLMDSNLANAPVVGRVVTSLYDAIRLTGDPTAQQLQQMAFMTDTQISEQKFSAWRSVGVSTALSTAEAYLFFTPGGLALSGAALKAVTPEFVASGIGQGIGALGKGFAYVAPDAAGVFRGWAASGGIAGDFVEYSAFRTVEFKPAFASELDAFGSRVVSPYIEQEQAYIAESVAKGIAPDVAEATAYRNLHENLRRTDIGGGARGSKILAALEREMTAKNISIPLGEGGTSAVATAERVVVPEQRLLTGPASAEPIAPALPRTEAPSIVPPAEPVVPAVTTAPFTPTAEQIARLSRPLVPAEIPVAAAEVDVVRGLNTAVEVNAAVQAEVRAGTYAAEAPIVRAARDDFLVAARQLEEAGLFTRLAPLDAEGVVPIDRIYRAGTGEVIAQRVAPIAQEEAYQILGQELQELQGLAGATRPVPQAPLPPAPPLAARDIIFPTNKPVFQATPAFSPLPQRTTVTTLVLERPAFDNMLANLLNPNKLPFAPLAPELSAAEKLAIERYGSTDGAIRNLRIQGISPSTQLFSSYSADLAKAKAGLTTEGLRISDITGAIHKGDVVVAVQKPVVFPGESLYAIVAPLVEESSGAALAQAAPKTTLPENAVASRRTLLSSLANVPNLVRSAVVAAMLSNPVVGEFLNIISPAIAEPNQIALLTPGKTAPAPAATAQVPNIQPQGKTVASIFGTPDDKMKGNNIMASGQKIDYTQNKGLFVVAHKTLPFGTEVLIRNPANGKTVVAQVGERGPYVAGRELDLFEVVARELGFAIGGKGVIAVEWAIIPSSAKGITPYKVGRTDLGDLSKNGPLGNTASLTEAGTKYAEAFAPKTVVAANTAPTATPLPQPVPAKVVEPAAPPASAAPVVPSPVVRAEVVALEERAAGIQTQLDSVSKNITVVRASADALKGVQGSITGSAAKAEKTEDTMESLTYTKQAVNAGARLVNPIENIARTAGDTQLLRSAQVLAKERNAIASSVSAALNTYKTTQSKLALMPYMGLQKSVPALLDKGNGLIAQAQRVADATTASLQRQKATLASQLETTNQKLAVAQQSPPVLAKVEDVVPAVKVPPIPPDEIIVVAKVDNVMTLAADMKGAWPGLAESEEAALARIAEATEALRVGEKIPESVLMTAEESGLAMERVAQAGPFIPPAQPTVRVVSVTAAPEKPYMPRVVQYPSTVNAPSAPLPTLQARFSNAVRKPDEPQQVSGSGGALPETNPLPEPTVYILTGGTSAGKTAVAENVLPKLNPKATVIEGAPSNAADITQIANERLDAGEVLNVAYVHSDPIKEFSANRTVSIDAFANSYAESWQAVKGLLENQAL
ncbi:MAG: hypothetical protein Q7R90_00875, partial [bacterium]|nr:hypothetical protein [bacterium]